MVVVVGAVLVATYKVVVDKAVVVTAEEGVVVTVLVTVAVGVDT